MTTKLEELKAAAEAEALAARKAAGDIEAAAWAAVWAAEAAAWAAAWAIEATAWAAYKAELEKTQEENSDE